MGKNSTNNYAHFGRVKGLLTRHFVISMEVFSFRFLSPLRGTTNLKTDMSNSPMKSLKMNRKEEVSRAAFR